MNRQPLLIFPCNGNAIEALDCLGDTYRLLGFIDDAPEKQGSWGDNYPVWDRQAFARFADAQVLAVPGSPASYRSRQAIIESLGIAKQRFATVIHPAARISPLALLGCNVLIMAGVVITSNAVIGDHTCILPNTVVHHDVVVGDWSLVGANVCIAGHTLIERNCYIGSGSNIKHGLCIGAGALVGLGSNVLTHVAPGICVAGNPARPLATHEA